MIDFGDPRTARRFKRWALTLIALGLLVGAGWYVVSPGVASLQIGYPLALPAIITAIVWIGRRLPIWLNWVLALLLAAGGVASYVLLSGDQLWLWGQSAVIPLLILVALRSSGARSGPWYGGPQDGPWGPP